MPAALLTSANPLLGLTDITAVDDEQWRALGHLSDQRLVDCAAEVVGLPRRHVDDDRRSYVLHAPLELMARSALLPFLNSADRESARRHIVSLAAGYQESGPPLPDPPARSFASLARAAATLIDAIDREELDEVDATAAWLGNRLRSDQVVHLLADPVVDRLSAAGHGSIYLQLLGRNQPRGLPGQMLRHLARALATESTRRITLPHLRTATHDDPRSVDVLLGALARVQVTGPADHTGIAALVDHASCHDTLREVIDADGTFVAPVSPPFELLRFAAQAMLQGPVEFAPYGWTHCLTLAQAALMVGTACDSSAKATFVATTYLAAHWAASGDGRVDLGHVPVAVDVGLDEALTVGPAVAAAAAWHNAVSADTITSLATSAALSHDAHCVKYTLACLDASAADHSHRPLYLAAAAYLNAWWIQHPDPSDTFAPTVGGQASFQFHHFSRSGSRPPSAKYTAQRKV